MVAKRQATNKLALLRYLKGLKPLSLWELDEEAGVAHDSGSLANHGTYTNTPTLAQSSLLPNKYGKSAYFNGTLSAGSRPYVEAATNAGYDTGTFTIVALAQFTTVLTGGTVVNWRDSGNNDGFTIEPSGATTLNFYCYDTAFRTCTQTIAAGVPYLIIARANGTNIKLALTNLSTRVTAAEASAACGNMAGVSTDANPRVRIGASAHSTTVGMNGNVQLVTWIGSAISDAQVADIQRLALS